MLRRPGAEGQPSRPCLAPAVWEDAKLGVKTFNSYDRMAIVTDSDSVRRTIKAFGWLIPGEVRVFHLDRIVEATVWITD
jgi:hypothetical protein